VDVAANAPEAGQEDGCGLSNAPPAPPRERVVDAASFLSPRQTTKEADQQG
jgi:hypothetical protein